MEVKYVQLPYWDVISREAVNVEQQVTRFSKISKSTIKITIDWMSN